MERSSNPALRDGIFPGIARFDQYSKMTIEGTINKTVILLALVLVATMFVWNQYSTLAFLTIPAIILGVVIALVTIFKREYSPYTAPVYAVVKGIILGLVSGYMDHIYPGVVIQAVCLTFGVFFLLLFIFRMRLIPVTEKFKLVVIAATGSIALLHLANFVLSFFVYPLSFINDGGLIGIGFSVVVIIVASLMLILDFNFIEKGSERGVPKYLEWYGAFALLVTLVWLYVEIIRLLRKLRWQSRVPRSG
jgi:uncharacterized YccA/Bax inhibitor family protein